MRYLVHIIKRLALDNGKMAFISGPRQVGKTTLAKSMLNANPSASVYYNWDDIVFRRRWTKNPSDLVGEHKQVVFDELHKAKNWKSSLKGLFDTLTRSVEILVTGSARLNIYRKGGDSLLGRYFLFRLHPFSVGELCGGENSAADPQEFVRKIFTERSPRPQKDSEKIFNQLMQFGGFPEPYIRNDPAFANVWRQGRIEKLIREDLRDMSRTVELSQIEMLASLLPLKVGSPLSVESLREDLEVAHDTVKRWLLYLEQLYYFYPLRTYSSKLARSIKKERKIYLYDWSEIDVVGARFENCVVSHFHKAVDFWGDSGSGPCDLFYLRNKEKKEVDILVTHRKKPLFSVECKSGDKNLDKSFLSFAKKIGLKHHIQLVHDSDVWQLSETDGVKTLVASADKVLRFLP